MTMTTSGQAAVHLVDDEAPVRVALDFLLRSHGLAVCSYDSGPAFLERLAQQAPVAWVHRARCPHGAHVWLAGAR
jgi:FixJ family two-component response regulator